MSPFFTVVGFVFMVLRIFFCVCPSSCIRSNDKKKQNAQKVDADHRTSLLRDKRVSIARTPMGPNSSHVSICDGALLGELSATVQHLINAYSIFMRHFFLSWVSFSFLFCSLFCFFFQHVILLQMTCDGVCSRRRYRDKIQNQ